MPHCLQHTRLCYQSRNRKPCQVIASDIWQLSKLRRKFMTCPKPALHIRQIKWSRYCLGHLLFHVAARLGSGWGFTGNEVWKRLVFEGWRGLEAVGVWRLRGLEAVGVEGWRGLEAVGVSRLVRVGSEWGVEAEVKKKKNINVNENKSMDTFATEIL